MHASPGLAVMPFRDASAGGVRAQRALELC